MDSGTAITAIIIVAICVIPVVIMNRNNRKRKKYFFRALSHLATKNSAAISRYDIRSGLAIGMDASANEVFFCRNSKMSRHQYSEHDKQRRW